MADGPLLQKWKLMQTVIADGSLSMTARLVMGRLLGHHNTQTGRCSPSYQTLADGVGLKRRAVIYAIQELEKGGWLEVDRVTGGDPSASGGYVSNTFRIAFDRALSPLPPEEEDAPPVHGDALPPGAPPCTTPVHDGALPRCTVVHPNKGNEKGKGNREESLPLTPSRFDEWWLAYPKKVAKDAAGRVFDRVVRDRRATVDELITATRRYAAEQAGKDPKYVKHPATWLNGGCWADEPAPRRSAASAGPARGGFSVLAYVAGDSDDDE